MKKIILIVLILCVIYPLLPIPPEGAVGRYNSLSGLIWCKPRVCIHELGHKLDDKNGWISDTPAFYYVVEEMGLDLWGSNRENYAGIYAFSRGKKENMPEILHRFYNWDLSEILLSSKWLTSQL